MVDAGPPAWRAQTSGAAKAAADDGGRGVGGDGGSDGEMARDSSSSSSRSTDEEAAEPGRPAVPATAASSAAMTPTTTSAAAAAAAAPLPDALRGLDYAAVLSAAARWIAWRRLARRDVHERDAEEWAARLHGVVDAPEIRAMISAVAGWRWRELAGTCAGFRREVRDLCKVADYCYHVRSVVVYALVVPLLALYFVLAAVGGAIDAIVVRYRATEAERDVDALARRRVDAARELAGLPRAWRGALVPYALAREALQREEAARDS